MPDSKHKVNPSIYESFNRRVAAGGTLITGRAAHPFTGTFLRLFTSVFSKTSSQDGGRKIWELMRFNRAVKGKKNAASVGHKLRNQRRLVIG